MYSLTILHLRFLNKSTLLRSISGQWESFCTLCSQVKYLSQEEMNLKSSKTLSRESITSIMMPLKLFQRKLKTWYQTFYKRMLQRDMMLSKPYLIHGSKNMLLRPHFHQVSPMRLTKRWRTFSTKWKPWKQPWPI